MAGQEETPELTHFRGGLPRMVDVSGKAPTTRTASAEVWVLLPPEERAALEAEGARLEKLGATRLYLQEADGVNESCLTMADVEGNEFCLD